MADGNTATTSPAPAHGLWDAVITALVLAALVLVVFKLVDHKGYTSKDVTGILGVIVPIFGAAAGLVIGAVTGNAAGQAKGEEKGKKKVLDKIRPVVNELHGQTPAGSEAIMGADIRPAVDRLHGIIEAFD